MSLPTGVIVVTQKKETKHAVKLGPSVSRTSCTEKFRGSQGFRGLILQVRKWFAHLLSICHQFTVIVPPVYISLPHEGPLLIAPKWQLANHHHHHHQQQQQEQQEQGTTNLKNKNNVKTPRLQVLDFVQSQLALSSTNFVPSN